MTQLSAQQQAGIDKIKAWYEGSHSGRDGFSADAFRLFGYAGTGKTTMAREIPGMLGLTDVRYGTYTGKAAHVLRSKGASPVSTIHSGIYMPTTSAEARERLQAAREELEELERYIGTGELVAVPGNDVHDRLKALHALIPALEADSRRLHWEWDPMSEWASAQLIILDEVSMVNAKLAADIEAYGVPILVLGDPAQLPPVEGGGYYTNAKPDHLLTEIHRQALNDPITVLATRIRESTDVRLGLTRDDMEPASISRAMEHEQVICWTNKRRWSMIKAIRAKLGRPEGEVVPGDKIMCLTNNKDLAVFNGQQFTVAEVRKVGGNYDLNVITDEGTERSISTVGDGFMGREMQDQAKNSGAGQKGKWMLATFAQAITAHKAQGSEYESVYVVNELDAMISMTRRNEGSEQAIAQARRWIYTSVTRARKGLTITAPRPSRY